MLYNVALVSSVQHESAMYPLPLEFPSPPSMPPVLVVTEHQAGLPVLYRNFSPAISLTHDSVGFKMRQIWAQVPAMPLLVL